MGEGTEKGVGQQAGNLNLRQSDGCGVSSLKQRDVLKTRKATITAAVATRRWRWELCVPSSRIEAASKPTPRSFEKAR